MKHFVEEHSIVRRIWGKSDTILLIFAGAAAEFALNKAVDWLYFTGKLPADPIGRLFTTVGYARTIVFSEERTALAAIDRINAIHAGVEFGRGQKIPQWAFRDVLFLLIGYSIRCFEVLERPMTTDEKREVLDVFLRMGNRMGIEDLPETFEQWQRQRQEHMEENLQRGKYTDHLFDQYRLHLGPLRYRILREAQAMIVPGTVRDLLGLRRFSLLSPLIPLYKLARWLNIDRLVKALIVPARYEKEVKALDRVVV